MISLHGRDAALLVSCIAPRAKILALTEGHETVIAAARWLAGRGYGDSQITVLEHMGGPLERQESFRAREIPSRRFSDLSTIAIECRADVSITPLARVPGLPDDAFIHDGQITKREVRAITLAALGPTVGALLWDIGAGCGSISIEWMRSARNARASAFECNDKRREMIKRNAQELGVPGLGIVAGCAPDSLQGEAPPDAVFIGGSVTDAKIFAHAWTSLTSGGRMVANAVTLEGEAALSQYHTQHGGEIIRIGISHLAPLGDRRTLRPQLTVTQWRAVKT
jgi:precorrin-6Y C5,15-methyltransferase (decarboxylating)